MTEDTGLLGDKVIHRTDIPTRLVPDEPRQIHAETLFGTQSEIERVLSQVELRQYRSYKHTLFGIQEGKCNGCQVLFPFRNMTIDHIIPRSRGGDLMIQITYNCCVERVTRRRVIAHKRN